MTSGDANESSYGGNISASPLGTSLCGKRKLYLAVGLIMKHSSPGSFVFHGGFYRAVGRTIPFARIIAQVLSSWDRRAMQPKEHRIERYLFIYQGGTSIL